MCFRFTLDHSIKYRIGPQMAKELQKDLDESPRSEQCPSCEYVLHCRDSWAPGPKDPANAKKK